MATKFLPYFNSICTGNLFDQERIRCPRLSHPSRDLTTKLKPQHLTTKFLEIVKKRSRIIYIATGLILGCVLLDSLNEDQTKRRNLKSGGIRDSRNFFSDVVDAAVDAVVQITVPEKTPFGSTLRGGSGFIVKRDGLIVTNAHVVTNKFAQNVNITLRNGRTFLGAVADIDETTDLAVIKINGKNLPVLKFGSANTLRVGEWVIAIGSPLFLSNSVTAGVVSSVQRTAAEIGFPHRNINYIQTDTVIATGNSGGPLLNVDGEVVGVNTMTMSPGISFAIPAEYVVRFVENYTQKSKKDSTKYYIGVSHSPLTPATRGQILAHVKLPEHLKNGVFLWEVDPNSPAYACGLKPGDFIFEVEGETVYDVRSVLEKVKTKPTVIIKLYRDGIYYHTHLTPRKQVRLLDWHCPYKHIELQKMMSF